ncbi:hypothetical protein IE4872_CH02954 [Rhizobium gallicum]|uniref:Uncharacterized protein n=1 Tax=Rhizobium gallicum TaxID=56730 RepID=A0A1L5NKY0_9HYPH|nr:hypothetical protein IE4872_CH02954 [Rhizobium gallicum]
MPPPQVLVGIHRMGTTELSRRHLSLLMGPCLSAFSHMASVKADISNLCVPPEQFDDLRLALATTWRRRPFDAPSRHVPDRRDARSAGPLVVHPVSSDERWLAFEHPRLAAVVDIRLERPAPLAFEPAFEDVDVILAEVHHGVEDDVHEHPLQLRIAAGDLVPMEVHQMVGHGRRRDAVRKLHHERARSRRCSDRASPRHPTAPLDIRADVGGVVAVSLDQATERRPLRFDRFGPGVHVHLISFKTVLGAGFSVESPTPQLKPVSNSNARRLDKRNGRGTYARKRRGRASSSVADRDPHSDAGDGHAHEANRQAFV